jgi:Cft2 family RNA processing exonuclease
VCFISHAHSDHLGAHRRVICTPPTARLVEHRTTARHFTQLDYGQPFDLDEQTNLTLHPAGHILGSAILYVRRPNGTFIYTGDFNSRPSVTVPALAIPTAETLMIESTYGLPFFRFPPREIVVEQFLGIIEDSFANRRQPIVLGYSLGKAQEIVRILTDAGHRVTVHGAIASLNEIYESCGVPLGPYRRYRREDFHGGRAMDLRERGVLVAPPRVTRTSFVTGFDNPCRIILTGWALLKNAKYRYGVDHALPMSDHADYDGLIETIERVQPKKIYTVHGYKEFTHDLRGRGYDATYAQKEDQLTLFDD